MIRYLFLALAIWVAILIVRHLLHRRLTARQTPTTAKSVHSVQCAYCGLHLPKDEAIQSAGLYFCSREHQQAMPRE